MFNIRRTSRSFSAAGGGLSRQIKPRPLRSGGLSWKTDVRGGQAEEATLCTRARSSEGNDPGLRTTDQPQSGLDVPQPTRRIAEALEVGRSRLVGEREDEVAHRLAAVLHVTLGLPMAQRHVRAGTLRGVCCHKSRPRLRLVNPDLADRSGQTADMATKRKPDYRPRKSARRFCTAVHSSTVTAPRRRSKRETDTDCTC